METPPEPQQASAPEVTVAVATRDRARRLGELLASLASQTLGVDRFEVVVVDDGSTDETPELLRRESENGGLNLSFEIREQSGGPAIARNQAWRAGSADLVAFIDDD